MRDFDMHEHRHGRGFGGHRMAKPLMMGAVIFVALGLLVMSLWNALLPAISVSYRCRRFIRLTMTVISRKTNWQKRYLVWRKHRRRLSEVAVMGRTERCIGGIAARTARSV